MWPCYDRSNCNNNTINTLIDFSAAKSVEHVNDVVCWWWQRKYQVLSVGVLDNTCPLLITWNNVYYMYNVRLQTTITFAQASQALLASRSGRLVGIQVITIVQMLDQTLCVS